MAAEAWVTTVEVAEHIGKPVGWIYQHAERLKMPRRRCGKQFRWRLSEVDAWLESQS